MGNLETISDNPDFEVDQVIMEMQKPQAVSEQLDSIASEKTSESLEPTPDEPAKYEKEDTERIPEHETKAAYSSMGKSSGLIDDYHSAPVAYDSNSDVGGIPGYKSNDCLDCYHYRLIYSSKSAPRT